MRRAGSFTARPPEQARGRSGTRRARLALAVVLGSMVAVAEAQVSPMTAEILTFRGMSDASAAVALDERHFAVADDETNALRVFDITRPGLPVRAVEVSAWLTLDREHPEADLEGAARRGRRVYWISSHGRNKNGEWRASRHQFVATEIEAGDGGAPQLRPAGKPYRDLAAALAGDPGLHEVRLAEAIRADDRKAKRLAPKAEGLNIEALAAAPDSEVLYLALRNPRAGVAEGKGRRAGARGSAAPAIVIPLMNADAVLERAARPEFGAPLLWDLGGYGIRSMDYAAALGGFLIAAGPRDDERGGMLYRWSGQRAEAPAPLRWRPDAPRFQPEAIVAWPGAPAPDGGAARVLVLSDDGAELVAVSGPEECAKGEYRADGTCPNKALRDPARRTFRAAWLSLRTENE